MKNMTTRKNNQVNEDILSMSRLDAVICRHYTSGCVSERYKEIIFQYVISLANLI